MSNFYAYIQQSLRLDPDNRPTSSEFLKHSLFTRDGFSARYQTELRQKLQKDSLENYRGAASSTSSFLDSSTNIESTSKTLQTPATKKKKPEIKDSVAPKDSKKVEGDITGLFGESALTVIECNLSLALALAVN